LIVLGTLAGLLGAARRFHVEAGNRRVEIALDWAEVSNLAQMTPHPPPLQEILSRFQAQGVSTLVITEDTLGGLEQTGSLQVRRVLMSSGVAGMTIAQVHSAETFQRIQDSLQARSLLPPAGSPSAAASATGGTLLVLSGDHSAQQSLYIPVEYANLRTLGLGLPPDALAAAQAAHLRIAGRISNFPGINPTTAANVLRRLSAQGATTVIFSGDDVLGYRGMENQVAALLTPPKEDETSVASLHLNYGAIEFGKQKGDEKLSAALHGEYVRVHSIQVGEMAQLDENGAIDRFVLAARERNIRFCFVRLLTFAGTDPIGTNVEFIKKITKGIAHGSEWAGGGMEFGPARPFEETGVSTLLFVIVALGVAAGSVWMARAFAPWPRRVQALLLIGLCIVCAGLAASGESGRKLVALLAGIVFPTAACLWTFPRSRAGTRAWPETLDRSRIATCVESAARGLALASAITVIGIVHVIGLLATRPFMLQANQFLGIKAQHAVPVLIVALAALVGVTVPGETWLRFKARAVERLSVAWNEPARFGLLLLGLVAVVGLAFVVARTGNDSGVGVSGFELKARALLDRLLPVRPRTKEFLVGHPAFLLGLAWWWRGRRRWAIPCFVVGSLGQVSLLNTFCHIHTPLIVSAWRDGIGLVLGTLIGIGLFCLVEWFVPPPPEDTSLSTDA
jgi:hypothetical protein